MSRAQQFDEVQQSFNFHSWFEREPCVEIGKLEECHEKIKKNIVIKSDMVKITNRTSLEVILREVQFYTLLLSVAHVKSANIEKEVTKFKRDAAELFKRKNADYGDAFALYGIPGVLMRMGDKFQRISSLSQNGVVNIKSESQADTIVDLYNYSIIALMLLRENSAPVNLSDRDGALITINKAADNPQQLNKIREYIIEETYPISSDVSKYKYLLEVVTGLLYNCCDHKWTRDYGEYVDSHTPHYCERCGKQD